MTVIQPVESDWRSSRPTTVFVLLAIICLAMIVGSVLGYGADDARQPAVQPVAETRKGTDWPGFLGPEGTGISTETGLIDKWPDGGPPIIWSRKVGTGYSAPSVRGNRLVLHHRNRKEKNEIVECMQASDGKPLWQYPYPSNFKDPYGYNNGPRCTPLLTEDRCYTYGAEGTLLCLNLATGRKVWQRNIKDEFDLPDWFFGVGCTPIMEGNLLIVLVGGRPNSGVVAFNAKTGKTVWESVGRKTWDGIDTRGEWSTDKYRWKGEEKIVSYSSPIAATIHGKRHILCLMRQGLVSLDPKDGSQKFAYWFRSRNPESVNAARPLVIGDRIFLSAAYRVGSAMLRVNKDGKGVTQLWRNRRNMLTHWSTAIHVDGTIYGFSGRNPNEGEFRAIDAATGKVLWRATGFDGKRIDLMQDLQTGNIIDRRSGMIAFIGRGSKTRVGDKFIVLGEWGSLSLVKINSQRFEELARTSYKQIHSPAWTAPVLSRKRLFLRCEDALICLDLKPR